MTVVTLVWPLHHNTYTVTTLALLTAASSVNGNRYVHAGVLLSQETSAFTGATQPDSV